MANTTVGAQVNVEFASVGQMRKAIKEATSDLIAMQEQFGKTSPQAIAAAKRIAELKDRIADAKEQADLFDPGKRFSAFANAANQIAAGFSAVQGAMALVGTESEDLQKTLVKVQGAVALSQGLSQLKDLGKAYDEIKIVAVDAFKSIRAAIGSTGIGLLVVALAGIVAYWDDIKEAVTGVSAEQKKLNEESAKNVKSQQEKLDAIGEQENILKLQGKSEKEILQIKVKQTDETIKASEIQLQNTIDTAKAQVETSKRNKEILQGILTLVTAPLAIVLKGIDAIGSALGKNFSLYEKFYGGISSLVFDPKKTEEEGNKTIKEQEKALIKLRDDRAAFQLQINKIDEDATNKRIEESKKRIEAAKKEAEEAAKIAREKAEAEAEFQRGIDEAIQLELDRQFEIEQQRNKQIEQEIAESEKRKFDIQLEVAKMRQQLKEDELRKEQEVEQAKQQLYADTGNALGVLSNIIGQETAAGKALAIAQATINTWLGATEVLRQKSVLPEPAATISKVVNVAAIVASGLKAVSNIIKVQTPRGGGGSAPSVAGGGAAPVAAAATPAVISQAVTAQAVNNLGNQAMRAYVLNSDITNNDQRNAYLQRNARLG